MPASLVEVGVGDEPALWSNLGFDVVDGRCRLGSVDIVLNGGVSESGIQGWSWLSANPGAAVGDIPTTVVAAAKGTDGAEPQHPNGTIGLFYVVLFGPSWVEAATALSGVGVDPGEARPMGSTEPIMLRSLADGGGAKIEVIGPPEHDPNRNWRLWGMIVEVADIDQTATHLGAKLRPVKDAVQPGRRIATLDRSAGSSVPIAFIGPTES